MRAQLLAGWLLAMQAAAKQLHDWHLPSFPYAGDSWIYGIPSDPAKLSGESLGPQAARSRAVHAAAWPILLCIGLQGRRAGCVPFSALPPVCLLANRVPPLCLRCLFCLHSISMTLCTEYLALLRMRRASRERYDDPRFYAFSRLLLKVRSACCALLPSGALCTAACGKRVALSV